MLRFAVEQVPAYATLRSVVDRHTAFEALKGFPPIDKDAVQKELDRHLPRSFESMPHYEASTGGTSCNQLRIFSRTPPRLSSMRSATAYGAGSDTRRDTARRPSGASASAG